MGKTSEFHPVTALIAESDSTTRRAIQIFAETHTEVQLCAVVATGQEMLDSLEQGMRPEVLVVDALLRDINVYSMIRRLNGIAPDYHPCILVTLVGAAASQNEKLLTTGANCTIFKPCRIPDLFDAICTNGACGDRLTAYCVRKSLYDLLGRMHCRNHGFGVNYLEAAIARVILNEDRERYTLSQLCALVGEQFQVDGGAVRSALERFNRSLYQSDPEAYARLSRLKGIDDGSRMTVSELLDAMTISVRTELDGRLE